MSIDAVVLTTKGAESALAMQHENPQLAGLSLRLYLAGKGCDGFDYGVCFDAQGPGDSVFPHEGIDVIVDQRTLVFVTGSSIDWVDDERGRGFLVDNPQHRKYRGKFYRSPAWKKRMTDFEQV